MALLLESIAAEKSTKDQLISVLSQKWPLTTKQMHFSLQRQFAAKITYQAVHKLLSKLEHEKIVSKNKNAWQLDSAWLQKQSTFFQQTIQKYAGNKNRYNFDPSFEGTQTFEFDNWTDLNVQTAELLSSHKLNPKTEPFYCVLEYGWWTFKFQFEQLELLYNMIRNCPNTRYLIQKKTPFGEWIGKQYRRVGGIGVPVGTNIGMKEDFFVQGDYIIEASTSEKGKKIIEHYWNKWHSLNDLFKEFGLKKEPKIESTVKITKNPQLAAFMKKELEKYFEKKMD